VIKNVCDKLNLATANASPREAQSQIRIASLQELIRLLPLHTQAPEVSTPDIVRSDRVIFVRPALFARVFVTR
jgi:hypothetical protein